MKAIGLNPFSPVPGFSRDKISNMEIEKMTYSDAIKALEEIVGKMQSPDCDIDHLAEYTSRALALMQHCKAKLTKTEEDVQKALAALSTSSM